MPALRGQQRKTLALFFWAALAMATAWSRSAGFADISSPATLPVAPPFRKAEFDMIYGEGISHTGEIVDMGVELGLITKNGSWFNFGETRLGQGREAAKQFFKENPEAADDLEAKIAEKMKNQ